MIKYLPELVWDNIEVKKVKSYKIDSADYQVKVSYKNIGKLPTALKQAHLVKIVTDDRVILDINSPVTGSRKPGYKILDLEKGQTPKERLFGGGFFFESPVTGRPATKILPDTQGGTVTTAIFNIRIYRGAEISGKASVFSTRGGVLRDKEFSIK